MNPPPRAPSSSRATMSASYSSRNRRLRGQAGALRPSSSTARSSSSGRRRRKDRSRSRSRGTGRGVKTLGMVPELQTLNDLQADLQTTQRELKRVRKENAALQAAADDADATGVGVLDAALNEQHEAKLRALQAVSQRKTKALMKSVHALQAKCSKLERANKDHKRSALFKRTVNALKGEEIISDVLKQKLVDLEAFESMTSVNEWVVKKTISGPKRFRVRTREELQVDLHAMKKKAVKLAKKLNTADAQLAEAKAAAEAAAKAGGGRGGAAQGGGLSLAQEAFGSDGEGPDPAAVEAEVATEQQRAAERIDALTQQVEQQGVKLAARDRTLRRHMDEIERLHVEARDRRDVEARAARATAACKRAQAALTEAQQVAFAAEEKLEEATEQGRRLTMEKTWLESELQARDLKLSTAHAEHMKGFSNLRQRELKLQDEMERERLRAEEEAISATKASAELRKAQESLKKELVKQTVERRKAEAHAEKLEKQNLQLSEVSLDLKAQLRNREVGLERMRAETEKLHADMDSANARFTEATRPIKAADGAEYSAESAAQRIDSLQAQMAALEKDYARVSAQTRLEEERRANLEVGLARSQAEAAASKAAADMATAGAQSAESKRIARAVQDTQEREARVRQENESLVEQLRVLADKCATMDGELTQARAEAEELRELHKVVERKLAATNMLKRRLEKRSQTELALRNEVEDLQSQKKQLEMDKSALQAQLQDGGSKASEAESQASSRSLSVATAAVNALQGHVSTLESALRANGRVVPLMEPAARRLMVQYRAVVGASPTPSARASPDPEAEVGAGKFAVNYASSIEAGAGSGAGSAGGGGGGGGGDAAPGEPGFKMARLDSLRGALAENMDTANLREMYLGSPTRAPAMDSTPQVTPRVTEDGGAEEEKSL